MIQRWTSLSDNDMFKLPDGEWVAYTDHIAEVRKLVELCEALTGILTPKQYTRQFPNVFRKAKELIAKAKEAE